MKNVIGFVVFTIALVIAGCNNGSSPAESSSGVVGISCADVVNDSSTSDCSHQAVIATVTVVDAGTIIRGETIWVSITIVNNTENVWQGYWGAVFDAGCNGVETWEIAPIQSTPVLATGEEWTAMVGGQCVDMPLGKHTLTATAYDVDPANALDAVPVQFNLVE
jgi:hypothetical protein